MNWPEKEVGHVSAEGRLRELNVTLPTPRSPIGTYSRTVRVGDTVYVAGTGSRIENDAVYGKLGRDVSVEEGYRAARICGLSVLATLRDALGSLDKVKRIVAVTGYVNATDDFKEHPKVLNGASDLFVEIFGEQGRQARTAVGIGSLPLGLAVEIEVIVEC